MRPITDINELKKIQMDILSYVDTFCRDNNIQYSISGGTLIGAIRHGGYIPWDDDIDIMMKREHYDRFIKLFSSSETSHYKLYKLGMEKGYTQPYANVADTRTIIQEICMPKDMGVNIDIFPIDYITDDIEKQKQILRKAKLARNKYIIKCLKWDNKRSVLKNIFMEICHLILSTRSFETLAQEIDKIARSAGDSSSKLRACIVWGYGAKEIVPKDVLENYQDINFEDRTYMAVQDYNTYLTNLFGDYMQLPPVEKQVSHHDCKAWWKD